MIKFLSGTEILKSAKGLIADGASSDLAVAYWGIGALDALGIDGSKTVRILCNLLSGGCNPLEIEKLTKKPFKDRVQLRHCHRLHSKLYLSPTRILIGSANASTNGLWDEGSDYRGTIEAMLEADDHSLISDAKRWFDQLWVEHEKSALDASLFRQAQAAYSTRGNRPNRPDALELLLNNPAYFGRKIWLTYYESEVSDEDRRAAARQKKNWQLNDQDQGFGDGLTYIPSDKGDLSDKDLHKLVVSLDETDIYEIVALTQFKRSKGTDGEIIWIRPTKDSRILGARLTKKDIRLLGKLLSRASKEEIDQMNSGENARGYFEVNENGEKDLAIQLEDLSDEILKKIRASRVKSKLPEKS